MKYHDVFMNKMYIIYLGIRNVCGANYVKFIF